MPLLTSEMMVDFSAQQSQQIQLQFLHINSKTIQFHMCLYKHHYLIQRNTYFAINMKENLKLHFPDLNELNITVENFIT